MGVYNALFALHIEGLVWSTLNAKTKHIKGNV